MSPGPQLRATLVGGSIAGTLDILLGLAVFLVMRLLVLPLSAFPYPVSVFSKAAGLDLLSHVFLFAGPIVLAAAKFPPRKEVP